MLRPPDPTPRPRRYSWPKVLPPLSAEGKRISDDWMRHWHEILPGKYGAVERFNHTFPLAHLPVERPFKTIEIGAGLGGHLEYEDLAIQEYHCVELRPNMARRINERYPTVTTVTSDCQERLPYEDGTFDRAVAIHVLEHLPNLPAAISEIARVLKLGGVFSFVIPCDPGLAYELARKISSDRIFRRRYNMPYGWVMGREHINSPQEILQVTTRRFDILNRHFYPLRVPLISANLVAGFTLRKRLEQH